jgi:hypothetical protein
MLCGPVIPAHADESIPPCLPFPACLSGSGGGSGPGGGSPPPAPETPKNTAQQPGHKHTKVGKIIGRTVVIGLAASSTALVIRGAYVSFAEGREMMYGEAFCTAEFFSPLVFKPLRLLGDLLNGRFTPLSEVVFCPEDTLSAQFSPALYAHVHATPRVRKKKRRH